MTGFLGVPGARLVGTLLPAYRTTFPAMPAAPPDLAESTSSLAASTPSSSQTLSRAKALYNQAARSFLHRRHVEAIVAAERAIAALQSEGIQDHSLAERLIILRLTLLATIYHPGSGKTSAGLDLFGRMKASARTTPDEAETIAHLEALLGLPTQAFLTTLWGSVLRFYVEVLPRLPLIQARAPPASFSHSIAAEPDTLAAALQPPAGVVAAAIMGALRIDDESKTSEVDAPIKGKKEARTTDAALGEGLKSARSMCEWVLSAHSTMAGGYDALNALELDHLYQQHARVLQLYTVHILGTRLEQWEFAQEVARCAIEIRHDEQELQDRQALLEQLTAAQLHLATRGERRRIASERARRRYEEEKAKRVASAEQQVLSQAPSRAGEAAKREAKETTDSATSSPPSLRRRDSGSSSASGGSERRTGKSRSGGAGEAMEAQATLPPTPLPSTDYAERREHISSHLDRQRKRANGDGPLPDDSLEKRGRERGHGAMQERALAWIRSLGENPSVLLRHLSALIAALFIIRRVFATARTAHPPAQARLDVQGTRSRLEQTRRQDESLVVTAARKVWATLRM